MNFNAKIGTLDWDACDRCKHARPDGGCDPLDQFEDDLFESDCADDIYCSQFEEGEYEDSIQEVRVIQYVGGNPVEIPKEQWKDFPKDVQKKLDIIDVIYTGSDSWEVIYGFGFPVEWEIQQRKVKK